MEAAAATTDGSEPRVGGAGRIPELDGLRGLAALAIVLFHSNPKRLPAGWAAVDLFFVLSGYLITAILLKHAGTPGLLRSFYLRRGLRIWPIYYLAIGLLLAFDPLLPAACNRGALAYDLTYTQTVPLYWADTMPVFSRYLRHTWTLVVEEQFYLVWPLLVLAAGRRNRVAGLALVVAGGAVLARCRGYSLMLPAARADGLALGGLLAVLLAEPGDARSKARRLRALGATALAGVGALIALGLTVGLRLPQGPPRWPGLTILAFNVTWFGVVGLAACGSGHPALRVLRRPRLRYLGQISYGLYLYHLPILVLSGDIARGFGLRGQPFWREGPTLALAFLAAAASWRWIEQPCLRLKEALSYDPARPRRAVPAPHFSLAKRARTVAPRASVGADGERAD